MEQREISTKLAGVDVGKHHLDATSGEDGPIRVENTDAGCRQLVAWLQEREVTRVGLESTGGYERRFRRAAQGAGLEVVVHQPLEVRLFARLKRKRAKSDRIDPRVIEGATEQVERVKPAPDPRLEALAERMSAYEQISDQAAELKTFLEHVELADVKAAIVKQIQALILLKKKFAGQIVAAIKACPDLAQRYELLKSLPGIGEIIAAALVIRMPELGTMHRGQAASLLGVAPFDRDSGQFRGQRFIHGGRARPRRFVYLAALVAKRCDDGFKAFANRLLTCGKARKVVVVAVMRKLIEAANLVLARGYAWLPAPPSPLT